jgi:fatty acid kinase fatty acid binding subunit
MVAIVTDSAANLPSGLASELGIEIVPMYLKFGERVYRDGVDLAPSDFYRRLVDDAEIASTSTPAPADFLEAYERTGQDEIVCITVASAMSAAHQEATLAGDRFDGRVEVVDSLNASMAQGFVALEAARRAAQGSTHEEVADRAREVARAARLCATIDTFEFLRRSGRVRKLQAYAATMLDIKPVFRFSVGEVTAVARPRTRRRAVARLLQETLADTEGRPIHLAAIHAAAEEEARGLVESISHRAEVVESIVSEVTPVIGAHTGPGLVGTAYFWDGEPGR